MRYHKAIKVSRPEADFIIQKSISPSLNDHVVISLLDTWYDVRALTEKEVGRIRHGFAARRDGRCDGRVRQPSLIRAQPQSASRQGVPCPAPRADPWPRGCACIEVERSRSTINSE